MDEIIDSIDKDTQETAYINYRSIVEKALDNLTDKTKDVVELAYPTLYNFGEDKALDKLATNEELDHRKSIDYIMSKKAAVGDEAKFDQDARKSEFGGKIKTVSDDMKQRLLNIVKDRVSGKDNLREIIREKRKIYDEELSKATDQELRHQIKQDIKALYTKERYKLNRIIRTESMNSAARAQLLRYRQQGVKEVTLQTSRDDNVCAKCDNLERSGKTWEVSKLINLGHYPLSTITHPQCRCVFHPIIQDITIDNNVGLIKNVPRNETDRVRKYVKETGFKDKVETVKNLADDPRFMEFRTNYYVKKGYPRDKAKVLAENDREKLRGKVTQITIGKGKDEKTLVDQKAQKANSYVYILAKVHAKKIWDSERMKQLREDTKDYYEKRRSLRYSGKKSFFNGIARLSEKSYFLEAFAHYLTHPEVLKEVDPEFYEYLKKEIFKGKEYIKNQL